MIRDSFMLLKYLKSAGYLKQERDPHWWPNSLSFEVVVGAILTQQTKWQKVEKSLENLYEHDLVSLQALADVELKELQTLIKPSGFYNTKAKWLKTLSKNILQEFGDFDFFQKEVSREWLLSQKGLGEESCDAILCYGCGREIMVVDSYTNRLLQALGYTFESYSDIQEWLQEGIVTHQDEITKLYNKNMNLFTIYSRFHGKIVEYAKVHIRGSHVNVEELIHEHEKH